MTVWRNLCAVQLFCVVEFRLFHKKEGGVKQAPSCGYAMQPSNAAIRLLAHPFSSCGPYRMDAEVGRKWNRFLMGCFLYSLHYAMC